MSLNCEAKCPAVLVVQQSSGIGKQLGLGLGLGLGGLALLALVAIAAVIVAIVIKRKASALDATALETAFVKNAATENNPLHQKEGQVMSSQAFDGAST